MTCFEREFTFKKITDNLVTNNATLPVKFPPVISNISNIFLYIKSQLNTLKFSLLVIENDDFCPIDSFRYIFLLYSNFRFVCVCIDLNLDLP